jgi:UDPglucose 6-dehydrogenase
VVVYDPKVPADEIRRDVIVGAKEALAGVDSRLTIAQSAYEAAEGAHAIAIVTEWDEFKKLDYAKIFAAMHKPASSFDGRNIVDLGKLRELGFRAHGIGR